MKNKKYRQNNSKKKQNNMKMEEIGKIDTPNTNTGPFILLVWYRHVNKKWRG